MAITELDLPEGFDASSGGGAGFQFWKLKKENDTQVLRVLPGMKGLLQKRDFAVFCKQHFGWMGRNPGDPGKTSFRPFLCIEEKRNGMVLKECPACKLRDEHQKKLNGLVTDEEREIENVRKVGKERNVTEDRINAGIGKIVEKYKPLKTPLIDWLKTHGVDSKFRLYAVNKQGQLGIFQIPYNLKKKLDVLSKELETEFYPKSIAGDKKYNIKFNGRVGTFLKFTRTGKASPTSDNVVVNTVEVGDEGAVVKDFHVASDDLLNQQKQVLPCLVEEVEALRLSDDKVEALVQHARDCGGSCDPDTVDKIMGPRRFASAAKKAEVADPFADGVPTGASDAITKAETPTAKAEEKLVAKSAEVEKPVEKVAEPTPPPAAPPAEPVAPAAPATPAVVNGDDMTGDQFDDLFS